MKLFELINRAIYGAPARQHSLNDKLSAGISFGVMSQPVFYQIDKTRVWGIDISGDYDGVVDCKKLKAAGASFIIIKCSNGSLPTKLYKENCDAARKVGLIVGAYHWLYRADNVPIGSQVKAVMSATGGREPDFYMVDFEWTSWFGKASNPVTRDLWGMLKGLEIITKKPITIYSALGYLNEFFSGGPEFLPYSLAIAQYQVTQPSAVKPWGTSWAFWQAADNADGSQLGVTESKAEDLDYWHSTLDDLHAFLDLDAPVVTPPAPTEITHGGTMKGVANLVTNVKPTAGGAAIDVLQPGEVVYGDQGSTDLINITRIYKADGATVRKELSTLCKAWLANLTLSNVAEPITPPVTPPVTPPSVAPTITHTIDVNSDGSLIIDGKPYA